jgi:hypothetical protein
LGVWSAKSWPRCKKLGSKNTMPSSQSQSLPQDICSAPANGTSDCDIWHSGVVALTYLFSEDDCHRIWTYTFLKDCASLYTKQPLCHVLCYSVTYDEDFRSFDLVGQPTLTSAVPGKGSRNNCFDVNGSHIMVRKNFLCMRGAKKFVCWGFEPHSDKNRNCSPSWPILVSRLTLPHTGAFSLAPYGRPFRVFCHRNRTGLTSMPPVN